MTIRRGPAEGGPDPDGGTAQLWFQVTLKFSPLDSAEVVALVVLPVAMLILSGP